MAHQSQCHTKSDTSVASCSITTILMWWVGGCMCSDLCGDCMHTCGDSITVGKHHTQVMQPHHTAQSTSTLRGHCVGRIFDPHECLASTHFTHPVSAESYQGFQVSSPLVTKSITAHRCDRLSLKFIQLKMFIMMVFSLTWGACSVYLNIINSAINSCCPEVM